jgi:intracellular multiplication protein IcmL
MSDAKAKKPPAPAGAVAKDSIVSVSKRNKDLEKRAFRATSSLAAMCIALAVSVIGNIYQGLNRPEPRYFAQDKTTGTLTPIIPLTQPISSRNAVMLHAVEAIGALNGIDSLNYRDQLNRAAGYFTKNAWGRYLTEFSNTGTLELIEKRNMVLNGVVTEPPVITGDGTIFNSLYWDVQVPYRVRYVTQGYDQSVDYVAKIKIVRVPTTENPKGIAIAQFVAQRGSADKGGK